MDGYTFNPPDWRDAQVIKRDRLFRYGKPGIYPDYRLFDEASFHPSPMDPPHIFLRNLMFATLFKLLVDEQEKTEMKEE